MMHEPTYIVTDGCMWEANKRNGTSHSHAIEVVDIKTGAVRFIRSGSRIAFIDGEISDLRTQEVYNKATEGMSIDGKDMPQRSRRKSTGKPEHNPEAASL